MEKDNLQVFFSIEAHPVWWARFLRRIGAIAFNHIAIFFSDGRGTWRYEECARGFKRTHEWPKCYARMLVYHPALLHPTAAVEALGWCRGKENTPYGWLDLPAIVQRWVRVGRTALTYKVITPDIYFQLSGFGITPAEVVAQELGLTCSAVCSQVATELLLNFGIDLWGTKRTLPDEWARAARHGQGLRVYPSTGQWPPHVLVKKEE